MTSIAHISDLHFGREDPLLVDALLALLTQQRPTLVAVSGDLTQRARRSQFVRARAFLERLPGRHLVVPGNHDISLFNPWARLRPFRNSGGLLTHRKVDTLRTDDTLLIGANSARRARHKAGGLSEGTERYLTALLDEPDNRRPFTGLVMHHPVFEPPIGGAPSPRRRALLRRLYEAGVQFVLSGHHHRPSVHFEPVGACEPRGGIWFVQAGTAVSERCRGPDSNSINLLQTELRDGQPVLHVQMWAFSEQARDFRMRVEHAAPLRAPQAPAAT
ncbi:MAG: metallophosphoesterase [Burkholderiaceae bacterium]